MNAFYHPGFLWGLLFLAAVVAIHLLRRPPRRTVEVPSTMFIPEQAVVSSRLQRLRSWMLLLTRLAVVAMIVLLFAHPYDRHAPLSALGDPSLTVGAWIDPTMSMSYSDPLSHAERAQALLDPLRASLPATVRLLTYDEAEMRFVDAADKGHFLRHGPSRVENALTAWENDDIPSPRLLLLLSDFQRPTATAVSQSLRRQTPANPVVCVSLAPKSPWNHVVHSPRFSAGGTSLSATVKASGRQIGDAAGNADLRLLLGGILSGSKSLSVPAGDSATITFELPENGEETGGSISLASTDDPLPFDNTIHFTLAGETAHPVLIIGDPGASFPLAAAFSALGKRRWEPVSLRTPAEVPADVLDSAKIIFLDAVSRPSREIESFLSSRASSRRLIFFALPADGRTGEAIMFLSRMVPASRPMKLVTLPEPAGIVLPDTISSLWRGFGSMHIRESSIRRYVENLPGEVVLRLDNGAPFVTRFVDRQQRTWVLFASPAGATDANNLCETGFFIPFLDRLTHFAPRDMADDGADPWVAGFVHRNPRFLADQGATLLDAAGTRVGRWEPSQQNVLVEKPGLYIVVPDSGDSYPLAVLSDPMESDLSYRSPEIPAPLKESVSVVDEHMFLSAVSQQGRPASYSPWILLALLLLAEALLWRRSAGSKAGRGG